MKKKMLKSKMIVVIALMLFAVMMIKIGTVYAANEIVKVKAIEVVEKSETVDVKGLKVDNGKIVNNVVFHKVGDKVVYGLTVENVDSKEYTIKSIKTEGNENITYEFLECEGKKLESNKEIKLNFAITYENEVKDKDKRNQNFSQNIVLELKDENGKTTEEEIVVKPEDNGSANSGNTAKPENNGVTNVESNNPVVENNNKEESSLIVKTGDNIVLYIVILAVAVVAVIVLAKRKKINSKGTKIFGTLLVVSMMIPSIVKATESYKLNIVIESQISLMDKVLIKYTVDGTTKEELVPYNTKLEKLENPSKDGFEFKGWKLEDGTDLDLAKVITEDMILVPQFEEKIVTSNITIEISDEEIETETKEIKISAVNVNILDEEVKLQYSLDDGNTWIDYKDPIVVKENGKIQVRTIEKDTEKVIGTAEKEIVNVVENAATFMTGWEVNKKMMELAGSGELMVSELDLREEEKTIYVQTFLDKNNDMYLDEKIKKIEHATIEQYNNVKNNLTEENIVSIKSSQKTIYMWFEDDTIFYYTDADKIYLNQDASCMFAYHTILENIDFTKIDTSKVKNMSGLFYGCFSFTQLDLSNFDTSEVINMHVMFGACMILPKIDLSGIDTSKVIDMSYMFGQCESLIEVDVSKFDTTNVTDMSFMFGNCENLQNIDISNFDTSKVTDMSEMFYGCESLIELDVSNFDTSKVTDMNDMFFKCESLIGLDVSSFDTSNVEDMSDMFDGCENLVTIYASEKFDVKNVTYSDNMFDDCSKLVGGNGTVYDSSKDNKTYARIDKTNEPGYFTDIADKPKE